MNINMVTANVPIVGTAPLVFNRCIRWPPHSCKINSEIRYEHYFLADGSFGIPSTCIRSAVLDLGMLYRWECKHGLTQDKNCPFYDVRNR